MRRPLLTLTAAVFGFGLLAADSAQACHKKKAHYAPAPCVTYCPPPAPPCPPPVVHCPPPVVYCPPAPVCPPPRKGCFGGGNGMFKGRGHGGGQPVVVTGHVPAPAGGPYYGGGYH